jgi:hypothetical protein
MKDRAGISLAVALCAISWNGSAREHPGREWYRVEVQLGAQVATPPDLLLDALEAARNIFAGVHVQLTWVQLSWVQLMWKDQMGQSSNAAADCVNEAATRNLAVAIVPHAPAGFSHVALATALPYADSGVRIMVFYDRVEPLLRGHHAPQATVLGYVLAHEIAHVLQGIARHSERGIMRARWTDNDFKQMGIKVLSFTPDDVQLIRHRLALRDASARCFEMLSAKR